MRAEDRDVLTVTGPPGYGKTTLLATFAEGDERPCAWVSLDAADNDPVLLLTYVALALDQIEPVDPTVVCALWTPAPSIWSSALPRFGRMINERSTDFVLVLDDVHRIVDGEARRALGLLVADLPPSSVLAMAGRALPRLPFGRLRVKRGLVHLGMQDLALGVDEATTMLEAEGIKLETNTVSELVNRTEGWPAALYLAALALRSNQDDRDPDSVVADFRGDHRLVADYLADEVLADLAPDVMSFLLGASCLDRLSGPLCDAALDRVSSAALLDQLERNSLLVVPLDDRREWYRLHHLLTDLLQAELYRQQPDLQAMINRRASVWFETHGDDEAAVRHALGAGDRPRAERLVYDRFGALASLGPEPGMDRWLAYFTREEVTSNALLTIIAAYAQLAAGDGDGALHWLDRAEEVVDERYPADATGWVPPVALALLRATVARLPVEEMADDAWYAYRHLPHGPWRAMACLLRGAASFMLGDETTAEELLGEGIAEAEPVPCIQALCLAHRAILLIERGKWCDATTVARRARGILASHGLAELPELFLVRAMSCLVEARAGNVAESEADRLLTQRNLAGYTRVAPWANFQARLALARADLFAGARAGARTFLNEIESMLYFVPDAVRVKDQLSELRQILVDGAGPDYYGPSLLTTAELRVLHFLPSHFTLAEIADRLFVSRNTVKSQAIAIYRKLGTSSRGAAVEVAREVGLLDDVIATG